MNLSYCQKQSLICEIENEAMDGKETWARCPDGTVDQGTLDAHAKL
jgi:hypothetical protein